MDSTDNIKGIEGIGIKKAEKILGTAKDNNYFEYVLKEYNKLSDFKTMIDMAKQVALIKTESELVYEGFDITSIKNSVKINELELDGNDRDSW